MRKWFLRLGAMLIVVYIALWVLADDVSGVRYITPLGAALAEDRGTVEVSVPFAGGCAESHQHPKYSTGDEVLYIWVEEELPAWHCLGMCLSAEADFGCGPELLTLVLDSPVAADTRIVLRTPPPGAGVVLVIIVVAGAGLLAIGFALHLRGLPLLARRSARKPSTG